MATVTGFTAERMLEIENTTVVDGEVVGDNLHLLQRDGTPIDAGNVRGPKGDIGPAGGVTNVNDQTGAVYAPRIFATKAALDSDWANAVNGMHAFTIAESTMWVKIAGTWYAGPAPFVFATKAALDAQWGSAPDGSRAFTTTERVSWIRNAGAWLVAPDYRVFPTKTALDSGWPFSTAPEGAMAYVTDTKSRYIKDATGYFIDNGIRAFASISERDSRWPNPPDGSVCTAPSNIVWVRYGGSWKALGGTLWAGAQTIQNNFPSQPAVDSNINLPTFPVQMAVTIVATFYGGYGVNTMTANGGIYTNNAVGPDNQVISNYGPNVNVGAGAWGKLGTVSLAYNVPANTTHQTLTRVTWSGASPNCYCHIYCNSIITTI